MTAFPTGAPLGVGAAVVDTVVGDGLNERVVVSDVLVADWAATGLPLVVEHPATNTATTARASKTPHVERFPILGAYVAEGRARCGKSSHAAAAATQERVGQRRRLVHDGHVHLHVDLGGEDDVIAPALGKGLADDDLRLALRVDVSG
jgi:hypothetical protein